MICPGSPYPAHLPRHRPPDSPRSQRSQRSLGSLPSSRTSSGSRSTVITYRSETTSSLGLFGKKTKDSFTCQFERSVSHISNTLSYYPSLCWSSPSVVIMSGILVTSNVSDSLQSEWWYLISRKTNEIVSNHLPSAAADKRKSRAVWAAIWLSCFTNSKVMSLCSSLPTGPHTDWSPHRVSLSAGPSLHATNNK